ncbi:Protein sak1 [Cyberlindnera fabianii]|uniref:Protein sak1 n=1 Tax=Cyberlindnera fabianii TaxID=36022 RepID=A0A1V2L1U9_CYBFA|nr:Protein sak1 [Cyberlindnera fabianii]
MSISSWSSSTSLKSQGITTNGTSTPTTHMIAALNNDHFLCEQVRKLEHVAPRDAIIALNKCMYTKPQFARAVALHCIQHLFHTEKGAFIRKEKAYDYWKLYFEKVYSGVPLVGYPQFGKLVKSLFGCQTRRIGSRSGAKYCYSRVTLKPSLKKWFEEHGPESPERVSFINDYLRFRIIPTPLKTSVDDIMVQFMYNESLDFSVLDIHNLTVTHMMRMLAKSDMLLKNFMFLISQKEVFDHFISDWYTSDVLSAISDAIKLPQSILELVADFPLVIDPDTQPVFVSGCKTSLLSKYFKLEYQVSKAHPQKVKLVNFIIELIARFPKSAFPNFILNFKYITTAVLRHLTMRRMQSFSTYWVLGCFLDEFVQFLLEYYAFRKDPGRTLTKISVSRDDASQSLQSAPLEVLHR